jgi:type II secretory pathway component PulM
MSLLKTPSNLNLALPWVLLVCLGVVAFQLWQDQLSLQKKLISNQQELAQITDLSARYQSLGGATKADQQRFTEVTQAIAWLTNSSKQQGIEANAREIEGEQQVRQIEVSFKQAHFNRLMQWLQQHNTTNLSLVSSQFEAANVGKVTGFIRFEVR